MSDLPLIEPDDDEAAETFEDFCHLCEQGLYGSVNETMMSNPRAETVWNNQRRDSSMATPLFIASCWVFIHFCLFYFVCFNTLLDVQTFIRVILVLLKCC
mmetsp:Transcript_26134/g.30959  ORF Transcript_26134/g.30959 Transcript_26134/m.30959 type:complete len:100 (+) Transcript_26134:64-363(+)